MTGGQALATSSAPAKASSTPDISGLPPPPAWMTHTTHPAAGKPTPQDLVAQIPGASPEMHAQAPSPRSGQSWFQKAVGTLTSPMDVGAGMLQGAAMNVAGNLYGIGKEIATGNFGHGLAERTSAKFQQQHAYQPATQQGASALQGAGNLIDRSGVAGVAPDMSMVGALDTLGAPAMGQVARGAKEEAGILGETARTAAEKAAPMIPGTVKTAAKAVGRGASYLVNPEASAGAKGARGLAGQLEAQIPKAPGEVAPVHPAVNVPTTPPFPKPSTIKINEDLAKSMEARGAALDAARKQAGSQIESTIAQVPQAKLESNSPLYKDLGSVKDSLVKEQENAGTSGQRAAIQTVINDIEHIRNNSNTPLSSLIELRRQLSQKAKFGQEVSGFDAIGTSASASLSKQLNDVLDQYIKGYKEARGKYGDVLDEQQPFRARMLKALGADETTGGDLAARVMQSPQNLKLAIEAAGGIKPVDAAITQRVVADLQGKTPQAIGAYIDEYQPILAQLPQAAKQANDILSKTEVSQALQDIQKSSELRFKGEAQSAQKAYATSHDLAAKYQGEFIDLNKLPAAKLPTGLRTVLSKMYNDKIITPQKYSDALDQVKLFEKSIERQKLVRRFSGAATAVGFAQYAMHRKMWNIIVGATH